MLAGVSANNAWLTVLVSIIPGGFLVYIYIAILKKSTQPFPLMLEEHLGRVAGSILGVLYVFIFLIIAMIYMRLFVEFVENMVLIGTPISFLIFMMLIPGWYMLYSGIVVFARVAEVAMAFVFPLAFVLLIMAGGQNSDWKNLMPVGYMSFKSLATSVYFSMWHIGQMIIIFILAFFTSNRSKIPTILIRFMVVLILFLTLAVMMSIVNLGAAISAAETFPLFTIARTITLAGFIQNIEIVYVSVFMVGIFISYATFWIMACYCCQQVFRLKDYRFLGTPTGVIVGFGAVQISPNIFTIFLIFNTSAPLLLGFFLVGIPILLYILLLFKPPLRPGTSTGLQYAETEHSPAASS